jgi:hypothetical protein
LQTALGEAVGLQLTTLVRTDQGLLLLDITVQNGEIKVGRGFVEVLFAVVGLENVYGGSYQQLRLVAGLSANPTVNDERSPVEENTRHLVGVRVKLLASKEAIEEQAGVGQTGGLNGQGRDGAAIGGISSAQPWKGRVVIGAVR